MRERLLAAFLSLTLLTVLLYGVPRAFVRAEVVNEQAQRDVERSAQVFAVLVGTRTQAGMPYAQELADLALTDDAVLLLRDGQRQVLNGPPAGVEGDALSAVAEVPGGGTVEVRRPQAVVRQDVVRALRPIVLAGLLALAVAALAGVVLAGRLARPFIRLADQAAALGAGRFDVDLPTQRVREAERIAAALRESGSRLTAMLAREREFARNVSHQLRTPLTGMRLRVEDVSLWPETPASVQAELVEVLAEVDRLSGTVTALLDFAREGRQASWEPTRLDGLLAGTAARWQPLAAEREREVRIGTSPRDEVEVEVVLPRIAVEQILDVLVDNALKHGRGTVTLRAAHDHMVVRLLVADEGEVPAGQEGASLLVRRSAPSAANGEGIGLSLTADLASSLGGRLRLVETSPTTFELLLPVEPVS